jgi:hypothetical protein
MTRHPPELVERAYRYLAVPVLIGGLGVTGYLYFSVGRQWWRAAVGLAGTAYLLGALRTWRSWKLGRISYPRFQATLIVGAVVLGIVSTALKWIGTR